MPNRKRTGNTGRKDVVRAARAGLIPASDDKLDEKRAQMNCAADIIRAVKPWLGSPTRVSDEQAITNILADLRHYCDSKGLAFSKFQAAACALYLEDRADEVA